MQSSPASNRSLRPNRTPKKSQYFESDASAEERSEGSGDETGYEDEASASPSSDDVEDKNEDEDFASDASEPPRKKQKKRGQASGGSEGAGSNKKDLWRVGVKAGLGPGTQVIIDKPRARSPGKTPYRNDSIHPNTMLFLADLSKNNDREWLKMHDPDYRTSWKDWMDFLECLTPKVSEIDETIPELPLKDCIFRIYRDIRFSPDPTPYKPFFSIAWSRTGRKGPYAAYYVQIKAKGGSFVGGGLWMPDAQALAKLRRDIDRKPHKLKNALLDAGIRKEFLGGIGSDEKRVVKAFARHNAESALKTKPRDYSADHQDIELLKLRNFTMGCNLADEEITKTTTLSRIAELIARLVPFVTYLNSVVMPDNPEESEDSEDEDEDEPS